MTKDEERIEYKNIRKTVNKMLSNDIVTLLLSMKEYQEAKTVIIYYPLTDEINTISIIENALKVHKLVALPKCTDDIMDFYYIDNLSDLKKGKYNIMEPVSNKKVTEFTNSICIVPGIAFDKYYHRLGYGKGYYDRFLKNYPGLKIGLCYEQLFINKISTDTFDIPVDIIITEKRIY